MHRTICSLIMWKSHKRKKKKNNVILFPKNSTHNYKLINIFLSKDTVVVAQTLFYFKRHTVKINEYSTITPLSSFLID